MQLSWQIIWQGKVCHLEKLMRLQEDQCQDSIKSAKNIQDWTLEELQTYHSLIAEDIYVYLQPKTAVLRRNSLGGTGFDQVKYQIAVAKKANEARK